MKIAVCGVILVGALLADSNYFYGEICMKCVTLYEEVCNEEGDDNFVLNVWIDDLTPCLKDNETGDFV